MERIKGRLASLPEDAQALLDKAKMGSAASAAILLFAKRTAFTLLPRGGISITFNACKGKGNFYF